VDKTRGKKTKKLVPIIYNEGLVLIKSFDLASYFSSETDVQKIDSDVVLDLSSKLLWPRPWARNMVSEVQALALALALRAAMTIFLE